MSTEAEEFKLAGNDLFREGKWAKAAVQYTKAIKKDPENAVYYSNRCAAYLKTGRHDVKALADATKCVELNPEWAKGYYRLASVHEQMMQYEEGITACRKALELEGSKQTRDLLRTLMGKNELNKIKDKKEALKDKSGNSSASARFSSSSNSNSSSNSSSSSSSDSGGLTSSNVIKTEEEYEEARKKTLENRGEKIPFDENEVFQAAKLVIENAVQEYQRAGSIRGVVTFLPGYLEKNGNMPEARVGLDNAFLDLDQWRNCIMFLRAYGKDIGANGCVLVALKSQMAYPQIWKHTKWPYGNAEGLFVQLCSRAANYVWFVPLTKKDGKTPLVDPQEKMLDYDNYQITPPLILDWDKQTN